jgi:hypothetical protein
MQLQLHLSSMQQWSICSNAYTKNMTGRVSVGTTTVDDNNEGVDEIKRYRDARWITPPKAL